MAAKREFNQDVILDLEKEREIHRGALRAFEIGTMTICGQTAPDPRWKDDTPGYIAWLKAKVSELTALIIQHSTPAI